MPKRSPRLRLLIIVPNLTDMVLIELNRIDYLIITEIVAISKRKKVFR
jgi:hypothetical protein